MEIIQFETAETCEPEKDWKRVSLCNQRDISVEHFTKPPHHASPLHKHPNAQVLVVLKGRLTIITHTNKEQMLGEGDAAYISGNEPHAVKNPLDQPSVGLDIFVPGRSLDFWLNQKKTQ